ncbi:MAG TPA: hypothetical protein VFW48_02070, partial [Solirubrobacterales bacterium]|nr:hypothetical protein [Solirubrobacterales bacterium]
YVADTSNNRVQAFDATGAFVSKWGSLGSAPGQFRFPVGVGVGPLGEVYVSEGSPNHRVQVFGDPPPTVPELLEAVAGLGLPRGIENSLEAKLRGAQASLDRGQPRTAANKLGALLSELAALTGKKVGPDAAAALTAEVQATLRTLSCLE